MAIKTRTYRNRAYLDWVKTLPCVVSGMPADDAHHIIGHKEGGMGTKASDLLTFPLVRYEHQELHRDPKGWEETYGSQWRWVAKTLERAFAEGVFR